MANPKSSTLFHFTKSMESIQGILKNGFFPRFSIEDIEWLDPDMNRVGLPIVCFCDIPLGRISEHVQFYGSYGIGLKRSWGQANGLNPLLYVSPTSRYAEHYKNAFNKSLEDDVEDIHFALLYRMAFFHKPIEGEMVVAGKPVRKEFYQESEWRYVAEHPEQEFLFQSKFEDQDIVAKANKLAETECALKFSPQDVKYIFVKLDSDIPNLVNFINSELGSFPSNDIKVLLTRIISLESIDLDL